MPAFPEPYLLSKLISSLMIEELRAEASLLLALMILLWYDCDTLRCPRLSLKFYYIYDLSNSNENRTMISKQEFHG